MILPKPSSDKKSILLSEIKKDKRPDIIALSKSGDVIVIECKQHKTLKTNFKKDIQSLVILKYFATEHKFLKKIINEKDNLTKWELMYNEKYANEEKGFDDFRTTLEKCFDIKGEYNLNKWISKVTKSISSCNLIYGFAIDGGPNKRGIKNIVGETMLDERGNNNFPKPIKLMDIFGNSKAEQLNLLIDEFNGRMPKLFIIVDHKKSYKLYHFNLER